VDYELEKDLSPGRHPLRYDVNTDVFSLSRGNGCTDETDPEDQIPYQRVTPRQARGEDVSKHDLKKGDEDHDAQED
jgi:hypothetical protein